MIDIIKESINNFIDLKCFYFNSQKWMYYEN